MKAAQHQNRKDAQSWGSVSVNVVGIIVWDRDVKKTDGGGRGKIALGDLDGEASMWMCCWVAKTDIIGTRNLLKGFFMQLHSFAVACSY